MIYTEYPSVTESTQLLKRSALDVSSLEENVAAIMRDVKTRGDEAVREYTKRFDKAELNEFVVTGEEIKAAASFLDEELKSAILLAKNNIEKFHRSQVHEEPVVEILSGVRCWREMRAIEKTGLYIPGGTAPLFSTVLMLAIPAQIAGCKQVSLFTPPSADGKIHPAILFAASVCGVRSIYKIGGVQ